MNRQHGKPRSPRSMKRTVAEWISLAISVALIVTLAGYLVYDGVRSRPPYVPVKATIERHRARLEGDRYILPIRIANEGSHTLRDLRLDIRYRDADASEKTQDFIIDYLGERSQQMIYIYVPSDPRTLQIDVSPAQYRLE